MITQPVRHASVDLTKQDPESKSGLAPYRGLWILQVERRLSLGSNPPPYPDNSGMSCWDKRVKSGNLYKLWDAISVEIACYAGSIYPIKTSHSLPQPKFYIFR